MSDGIPFPAGGLNLTPSQANNRPARPVMTRAHIDHSIGRLSSRLAEVKAFDPSQVRETYGDPTVVSLSADIATTLGDVFGYGTPEHRTYAGAAKLVPDFAFINQDVTGWLISEKYELGKKQSIALISGTIST